MRRSKKTPFQEQCRLVLHLLAKGGAWSRQAIESGTGLKKSSAHFVLTFHERCGTIYRGPDGYYITRAGRDEVAGDEHSGPVLHSTETSPKAGGVGQPPTR